MNQSTNLKTYRLPKLMDVSGLKRSSIYNRLDPNSKYHDPAFPKPISLSVGNRGSVAWIASEVDAWIETRIAARVSGING
jgi:predicted DNA-binding transcriptional regulator AlpA